MRKNLTFHGILFHSQSIRALAETGTLDFFGEDETADSASVVDVHENEIVRWILGHPAARSLLYSQVNLDGASRDYLGVARPVIEKPNAKPGDVDWLCVPPGKPHLAVAFECKRVKVRAQGPDRDQANKIDDLGRGV